MILFLRKIRQTLIKENKIRKYLIYAFGEIVLVVIGILIALQINTWNLKRIAKIEEQNILYNLNTEFKHNKNELANVIRMNENCFATGKFIMNLIGKDSSEIKNINTDSLLFMNFEYARFTPSENAVSDLLNSGRLKLIKNERVKSLIYQWSRAYKGVEDQFSGLDDKVQEELVPYLTQKYPMKNIDSYSRLKWERKSTLAINKLQIFQDLVYENILDDYMYRLSGYIEELNKTNRIFDDIIKETN